VWVVGGRKASYRPPAPHYRTTTLIEGRAMMVGAGTLDAGGWRLLACQSPQPCNPTHPNSLPSGGRFGMGAVYWRWQMIVVISPGGPIGLVI